MKSTRILLAEDDSNLGSLLKNYLAAKNMETSLFGNGILALDSFLVKQYDLCILDIMMPEMDGLTLAKEIRKINPSIPVILHYQTVFNGRTPLQDSGNPEKNKRHCATKEKRYIYHWQIYV
jgi:CheY-like chemotaxis protein